MPEIKDTTILVAVLNKKETIAGCLESLLKLNPQPGKIIVIDGYSKDGTYEILKKYKDEIELYQFPENLSRTLNWSLDKIETEYVALTDGDCIVDRNWLSELLAGFNEENVVATAGFCGTPEGLSFFQKLIGLELENRFRRLPRYLFRAPTMNLCLKTEAAKKIKFDENQMVQVEVDFGYRLSKLGKIVYVPEAKVFHYHRATLKSYFLQQKNQAEWGLRLLLKHGRRAAADPITTLSMTAQIPLLSLGLFSLFLSILNRVFLWPTAAFFLILSLIYLKNILEIKPPLAHYPIFLGFFIIRTVAWVTGITQGLILYLCR